MIIAGTLNLRLLTGCTFETLDYRMEDENGDPVDLTGYNGVEAQVRNACGGDLILDLNPSITDAVNGIVTTPRIETVDTEVLPVGIYFWDMLLEDGTGDRQQVLKGKFSIICTITQFET